MDGSGRQTDGIDVTPPLEVAVQALREFCRTVESTDPLESYLTMLCMHAVEVVADADMVGVSLINGDRIPRTVACTAQKVREIDDLQYQAWQGPCLEAAEGNEVAVADQDLACRRWPGFAAEARRYGVASFLSVPLPYLDGGSPLGVHRGAVTAYSSLPDGFGKTQTAMMDLVALAAGYAIMIAECCRGVRTVAVELEQVLGSGAVVDQVTTY